MNAALPVGVASSCRDRPGVAVEPETDPVTGELYIDRVPFAPAREDPLLERAVPGHPRRPPLPARQCPP